MAWDNNSFCGKEIITGDIPMDIMSLSVDKIAAEYEKNFDRKPTVAELLYAFKIAIACQDEDSISDPESLDEIVIQLR